jgi:two-component system NtrC family sensor kinase
LCELFGSRHPDGLTVRQRVLAWLRPWLAGRVSLRAKITAAFTLLVVGGTAVSTLIGSRIITSALLQEAQWRAVHGLDTVVMVYREALDATADGVAHVASEGGLVTRDATAPGVLTSDPEIRALLGRERLDFMGLVRLPLNRSTDPCLADESMRGLVGAAAKQQAAAAAEVLSGPCLASHGTALVERARTAIRETEGRPDSAPEIVVSGLALAAAAPVTNAAGRVVAVAYGGALLNRRADLVDRMKVLVYGNERYEGRQLGTASILLGDARIATNVLSGGEQAIGTRASPEVSRRVLLDGVRWSGRTFVVDDWYVAAYEPLRNHAGRVIGMLYIGILEAPILAVRTDVMVTFLVVCVVGLAIVFAFTYFITRRTISPLEEMVAATRRITAGDLTVRVSARSSDEIGDLAGSFNEMLASVQASKSELEEWGRTLEERVKERTDQLVAVQAQMARSEKLASIGRLAAGVAHSINNPLGGILSLSMLSLEGCRDPALRADLDTIAKQALRCREIVKGLLEFSHQTEARAVRTDVNAIVDGGLLLLQRQAALHQITIERRFQQNLPAILIDPGQLQEVITNLVVNAVDAMEDGGTLTIETGSLARAAPSGQPRTDVVIRVADTGKGIPQEVMPFLFEPFFTTKTVGKGTGLGLAIVHGVVTRAGGRVEVSSSPAGTTFTIHVPAAPAGEVDDDGEVAGRGSRQSAARV